MARQFAVITGASTGIGLELARVCAREGFDLLIAADEPEIETAAAELRQENGSGSIEALNVDLAAAEGVDQLYQATNGRTIDVLMANAGRGLGRAFLDQDLANTDPRGDRYEYHRHDVFNPQGRQ
jgi:short-subunit dehydrogenase